MTILYRPRRSLTRDFVIDRRAGGELLTTLLERICCATPSMSVRFPPDLSAPAGSVREADLLHNVYNPHGSEPENTKSGRRRP